MFFTQCSYHIFKKDNVDHKKEVVKLITKLSGKYSPYQIFSDFVTIFALAIVNTSTLHHDKVWQDREQRFLDTINRYTPEEQLRLVEIKEELILAFENEIGDVLGEIYMESGSGNKNTGQFFTPFHLSEATAELSIPEDISEELPFMMNEPSAGAGGMILAVAKVLNERGVNYQKCMKVVAQDLDWTAAYMCYIQLSMYGIDGIVCQGDTLSEPYHSEYPRNRVLRTPRNAGMLIPGWE